MSEQTVKSSLVPALAKAQSEMKNAALNRTNPHFKSKYADLAAIRDATTPILAKNGLAVTQTMEIMDGSFFLKTTLRHESGETIESVYPLPMDVSKPQAMGSALTYARRYSLASMCGISAEEDDDANAAEGAISPQPPNHKPEKSTRSMDWHGPLTKTDLRKEVQALVRGLGECMDAHEVDLLVDEYAAVIEQVKKDLPAWWNEHDPAKPEFIPLETRIEQARELNMGTAQPEPQEAESLEISPKGPGGWVKWDEKMRDAIESCDDITKLSQLEIDNAAHLDAYAEKFEPSAQALRRQIATRAGNLSQAPADG